MKFPNQNMLIQAIEACTNHKELDPMIMFQCCENNWDVALEKFFHIQPASTRTDMMRTGKGYYWRMCAQRHHAQVLGVFLRNDPDPKAFLSTIEYSPLFDAGLMQHPRCVLLLAPYVPDQVLWRATNQYLKTFDEIFAQLPYPRQVSLSRFVSEDTHEQHKAKMPYFHAFLEKEHLREAVQLSLPTTPPSSSRKM